MQKFSYVWSSSLTSSVTYWLYILGWPWWYVPPPCVLWYIRYLRICQVDTLLHIRKNLDFRTSLKNWLWSQWSKSTGLSSHVVGFRPETSRPLARKENPGYAIHLSPTFSPTVQEYVQFFIILVSRYHKLRNAGTRPNYFSISWMESLRVSISRLVHHGNLSVAQRAYFIELKLCSESGSECRRPLQ